MHLFNSDQATGVALSLATSVAWAISPIFMASVGRRIGSQPTNMLRAGLATVALCCVICPAYLLIRRATGVVVPMPRANQAFWIVISGVFGMVLGDSCYYEALVLLGPRRAVKMNTLAPVVGLLAGWLMQGELLTGVALAGAAIVIAAVMYATFASTPSASPDQPARREPGQMSPAGLAFGLASAACIGLGSVLGRQAYKVPDAGTPLDPIIATTLRVATAAAMLWLLAIPRGAARSTLRALADPEIRTRIAWGTLLGPILGMLTFVSAIKYAPAGLVSTIISTSPLVILPILAVRYHLRVPIGVILALLLAVLGVAMISWK